MSLRKSILVFITLFIVMFGFYSCKKGPGSGGNSSIKGYVHVKDYNATLIILQGEYDGADRDVYLIYGDDPSYGDRIKTGPDGVFEFKYLRKGSYTVYTYSDDTTLAGTIAISKTIEISDKKQTVDAGTFVVKKN